ncbi:leucine-rich repeat protein [Anaerolentibacter hominis]|uniref:leucine-rich repeat protein n=1 Tax=Anaerolentibacter hominis TaxID=3079009 RepID=UPI0031B7FF51
MTNIPTMYQKLLLCLALFFGTVLLSGTVCLARNHTENESSGLYPPPPQKISVQRAPGSPGSADAALKPLSGDYTLSAADPSENILEVTFDSNDNNTSMGASSMKDAIDTALSESGKKSADVTGIKLTGKAAEITAYNWKYLLERFTDSSGWTQLFSLDLSAMDSLRQIKNDPSSFVTISQLTAVHFPDGLRTIGDSAFSDCINLKDAVLPGQLEFIGYRAFFLCRSLDSAILPSSLESIGDSAYDGCKSLTDITLPKNLKALGKHAFGDCENLKAVSVAQGNLYFKAQDNVLYNYAMTSLLLYPMTKKDVSFLIPGSVTSIADSAFFGCKSLAALTFPAALESIGDYAFFGCKSLTALTFPAALESIGNSAFYDCKSLTALTFPAALESIEDFAFFDCSNLNSLSFRSTLPPAVGPNTFLSVSYRGTIFYPSGAAGYTESWNKHTLCLPDWTLQEEPGGSPGFIPAPITYPLTLLADTGGRISVGTDASFVPGTSISLLAVPDNGYSFDGWISSGGGSFSHPDSPDTSFIMPAEAVTVTARFCYTGEGPEYLWRTLSHEDSGITVSGYFSKDAVLSVQEEGLHKAGSCYACDDILRSRKAGQLTALYNISLSSGSYKGILYVEFPVSKTDKGEMLTILHCKKKVLETYTLPADGSTVRGSFTSLSPFAVVKTTKK